MRLFSKVMKKINKMTCALKIIGRGPDTQNVEGGFEIVGCPHPPCNE
jgi:hypothetical protein